MHAFWKSVQGRQTLKKKRKKKVEVPKQKPSRSDDSRDPVPDTTMPPVTQLSTPVKKSQNGTHTNILHALWKSVQGKQTKETESWGPKRKVVWNWWIHRPGARYYHTANDINSGEEKPKKYTYNHPLSHPCIILSRSHLHKTLSWLHACIILGRNQDLLMRQHHHSHNTNRKQQWEHYKIWHTAEPRKTPGIQQEKKQYDAKQEGSQLVWKRLNSLRKAFL